MWAGSLVDNGQDPAEIVEVGRPVGVFAYAALYGQVIWVDGRLAGLQRRHLLGRVPLPQDLQLFGGVARECGLGELLDLLRRH